MTKENKAFFRENNIDIDMALERFSENEELYLKYFNSFPEDNTYTNFINSFKADKLWQSHNLQYKLVWKELLCCRTASSYIAELF